MPEAAHGTDTLRERRRWTQTTRHNTTPGAAIFRSHPGPPASPEVVHTNSPRLTRTAAMRLLSPTRAHAPIRSAHEVSHPPNTPINREPSEPRQDTNRNLEGSHPSKAGTITYPPLPYPRPPPQGAEGINQGTQPLPGNNPSAPSSRTREHRLAPPTPRCTVCRRDYPVPS